MIKTLTLFLIIIISITLTYSLFKDYLSPNINGHQGWKPPFDGGSHISSVNGSIFSFNYNNLPERSIVFYFPFDINSKCEHSANEKLQTFNYSGILSRSPSGEVLIKYQIDSVDSSKIRCNDYEYKLDKGSIFLVSQNGTIRQLPFIGLKSSSYYLSDLKKYFNSSK